MSNYFVCSDAQCIVPPQSVMSKSEQNRNLKKCKSEFSFPVLEKTVVQAKPIRRGILRNAQPASEQTTARAITRSVSTSEMDETVVIIQGEK